MIPRLWINYKWSVISENKKYYVTIDEVLSKEMEYVNNVKSDTLLESYLGLLEAKSKIEDIYKRVNNVIVAFNTEYKKFSVYFEDMYRKGACFMTTACIEAKELQDNCTELSILRTFRDDYVLKLPNGEKLISEYYSIGPKIIENIKLLQNSKEIFLNLYNTLVLKSIQLIRQGKHEEALQNYINTVKELKLTFM
jgi:hypothetical protein